ncbi:MAG: IclR family transcriptional regulator [Sphingopyxis sp.]|uniref:IclR family transcriptional regulator n=1 Tax=Sphingopyxis sp. TaxID=1908224 RepID=UPI001A36AFC1|nr:IclR family transcriptional regulator [Sphingopyxis sp.]MBL9068507.1 IclR family transcriptional regulator [Sphingopyxis sp.]
MSQQTPLPPYDRDLRRQSPTEGLGKIEAVATATAIIDLLAERGGKVGVQDVATVLGLTKSRASRHLSNLEQLGLVQRQGSRGYELGWRLVRWGHIAASRFDLGAMLDDLLVTLGRELQLTVLLCTAADGDAVVQRSIPAPQAIHIDVKPGLVLSLPHSPTARIVFAFQSRERREELLDHLCARETDFRVEDRADFMTQIADIQRHYVCWTRDKFNLGHGAVAAPIFDRHHHLCAVVTVMIPSSSLGEQGPPRRIIQALLDCCRQSSRRLNSRFRYPDYQAAD